LISFEVKASLNEYDDDDRYLHGFVICEVEHFD